MGNENGLDLAQAEITLREAEVTARQRELASLIFTSYSEALASLKEIATLEDLLELDTGPCSSSRSG